MVDLYQRIFKLSWHLLRAPWLWGKNGGLGSGKGRQDPQGLQHLLQKRDKNTSDCAILGSMVWKRPHFLKASLLKNCSQGGQTPMAPPPPQSNCRTTPNWLYPVSNKILSCFSGTTEKNCKSCNQSRCRGENFALN